MGAGASASGLPADEEKVRIIERTDTALGKIAILLETSQSESVKLAPREDSESSDEEGEEDIEDEEDKKAAADAKAVMGDKPKKIHRPPPSTREEMHAMVLSAMKLLHGLKDDVTKMQSEREGDALLGDRLIQTFLDHGLHKEHGLDYIPVFRECTGRRVVMPMDMGRTIEDTVNDEKLKLALTGPQRLLFLSNVDMQGQKSVDVLCEHLRRQDLSLRHIRLYRCNLQDDVLSAVAVAISHGSSRSFLRSLDLTDNELVEAAGFTAAFEACPYLTSVNLTMCQKLTNEDLIQLCKHCPSVRSLSLRKCFKITEVGVRVLVDTLGPRLLALDLALCSAIADHAVTMLGNHCHNLEHLDLLGCKAVTSKSIVALAEGCGKLKTLTLSQCQRLAEFGLTAIGQHMRCLTSLDLSDCWLLKDPGLSALHACERLACLNLAKVVLITDECLAKYGASLRLLERIELEGCTQISDVGLDALAKGCPNLITVGLQNCAKITDTGIYNLSDHCRHITTLRLDKCNQITDMAARWAGERMPGLQCLGLNFCKSITDAAAEGLPNCGNLNQLLVGGCAYLTDRFLQEISGGYKRLLFLESINISKCAYITDVGIAALTAGCGHKLRDINIADCQRLTNKSIFSIASTCGVLRVLRCNNITQLTNNAVNAIAKGCRFLRLLNIEGCSQITDAFNLATCSDLRLVFIGGTQITEVEPLKSVLSNASIPRWPEAKHPTSVDAIMR